MAKLVWNGCDGYVEADVAVSLGYNFDGEKLYKNGLEFSAFEAVKISKEEFDKIVGDENSFSWLFGTETGNYYKLW